MKFIDTVSSELKKTATIWLAISIVAFWTMAFMWGFEEGKYFALHNNALEEVKLGTGE